MQISKKTIRITLISSLGLALLMLGTGVVYSQNLNEQKAIAQGYNASTESPKSEVLGESSTDQAEPEQTNPNSQPAAGTTVAPAASKPSPSASVVAGAVQRTGTTQTIGLPHEDPEADGELYASITTSENGFAHGLPDGGFVSVPFQATLVIKDLQGNVVKTVQSDAKGKIRVSLAPGKYVVEPQNAGDFYYTPAAQNVTINGELTTLTSFEYVPMATTNSVNL